jgi:hypothetical protein
MDNHALSVKLVTLGRQRRYSFESFITLKFIFMRTPEEEIYIIYFINYVT